MYIYLHAACLSSLCLFMSINGIAPLFPGMQMSCRDGRCVWANTTWPSPRHLCPQELQVPHSAQCGVRYHPGELGWEVTTTEHTDFTCMTSVEEIPFPGGKKCYATGWGDETGEMSSYDVFLFSICIMYMISERTTVPSAGYQVLMHLGWLLYCWLHHLQSEVKSNSWHTVPSVSCITK